MTRLQTIKRLGRRSWASVPTRLSSHAKFARKYELPFPLLAERDHSVCELFGVWKEKSMYGKKYMGVERTTFVIDGKGIVRQIFPKVKVDGHAPAVLEAVRACG